MKQILAVLAPVNWLALLTAFGVGLASQATGGLRSADGSIYLLHFTLGLFSVLFALGVHCLIFIYFLGTGRWVKEVALAYGIPDAPLPKLTRELKRRTFPPALFAMLIADRGGGGRGGGAVARLALDRSLQRWPSPRWRSTPGPSGSSTAT